MGRLALWIFLSGMVTVSAQAQDQHLNEPGLSVVLAHSAFAHGYRHGYEEGYHIGNTDINLGRQPRAKIREDKGLMKVRSGYSSQFGSKRIFEQGFEAGLKAGYGDGYYGKAFRAVDSLRAVAASLDGSRLPADSKLANFDQGFFTGYGEGLERGGAEHSSTPVVDFRTVDCSASSAKAGVSSDQTSYCEGYRRGFALGHADGFALRTESAPLEASK